MNTNANRGWVGTAPPSKLEVVVRAAHELAQQGSPSLPFYSWPELRGGSSLAQGTAVFQTCSPEAPGRGQGTL